MRFSLLSALGLPDVMALEIDMVAAVFFTPLLFWWQMVCALLITALCIAIGLVFHLQHEIDLLQGKCAKLSQDSMLHEVLDLLKGYKLIKMKCWEMNMKQGKKIKKMNVDPIVETSPEPATGTDGRPHGEPPNGTDRLRGMQDTNAVLQIRYERLRLSMAQLRLSRMRT